MAPEASAHIKQHKICAAETILSYLSERIPSGGVRGYLQLSVDDYFSQLLSFALADIHGKGTNVPEIHMFVVKLETVKCCIRSVDSKVHRFFIWTRKI